MLKFILYVFITGTKFIQLAGNLIHKFGFSLEVENKNNSLRIAIHENVQWKSY